MPMPDVAARTEYWGVKVRKVSAHENPSHFQTWGRGNRAYYNGRHDLILRRKKGRLVVATTANAVVRKGLS